VIRGVFVNAIIIRFEGPFAVCRRESKTMFEVKRNLLPIETQEGDILEIIGNKISINLAETRKLKEKIQALINDIAL
jgi:hypothetical protein